MNRTDSKTAGLANRLCRSAQHNGHAGRQKRELTGSGKWRRLIEHFHTGIIVHAADSSVLFANRQASIILGLTSDQMTGKTAKDPSWSFTRADGTPMSAAEFPVSRVIATSQPVRNMEAGINRPALNDQAWVLVNAFPEFDTSGALHQVVVNITDITERRLLENTQSFLLQCGLAASGGSFFESLAAYLARTLEMEHVRIDRLSEDALSARQIALCSTGRSEAGTTRSLKNTPCCEAVDKNVYVVPRNSCRLFPHDPALKALRAESYAGITLRSSAGGLPVGLISAAGRTPLAKPKLTEALLKVAAIRAAGELERVTAEEALLRSRALLDEMGRIAKIGAWELDVTTMRQKWTDETYAVHDREKGNYDPNSEEELSRFEPGSRELIEKAFHEAVVSGRPYDLEVEMTTIKGNRKWLRTVCIPVVENGRTTVIRGTVQDITDHRQAMESLRRKNLVFDRSVAGNSIADKQGIITEANPSFLRIWGYASLEEVLGRPITDFLHDPAEAAGIVQALNTTGEWEGDYTARRKDGSLFLVHALATSLTDASGRLIGYQSAVIDITADRKLRLELEEHRSHLEDLVRQRSAELKASEEKFRTMADFTYDWEYWIAPDRTIVYVTPSCESITGYPPAAFYGDMHLVETIVHAEDRPSFMRHIQEFHLDPNNREVCDFDFRIVKADGTLKWIGHICRPVVNTSGVFLGRRISNRDITEKRRAEDAIRKLNTDLSVKSANLETVNKELEAFSYSVSHDLKAPLRSVDGFAQMLEEEYADKLDDEGRRILLVIRDSAREMGQLITDLLAFSRLSRKEMKQAHANIRMLVDDARRQVERTVQDRSIRWHVNDLPPAFVDEATIREVFINLFANAVKFTRPRSTAIICVTGRVEGAEVIYSVADNGVGFDMTYADKLFRVFQRLHTAEEFEGTGIGLALVQRIVQRHGGRVWADGKPGEGATFSFALPAGKQGSQSDTAA